MNPSKFIVPDAVLTSLRAKTKKQLLQELSARAAGSPDSANARSSMCCGSASGWAPPDSAKASPFPTASSPGLKQIVGIFARLPEPIDFDSVDGEKVDIVCLLLAPDGAGADHLKALARISRLLRDGRVVEKFRASKDAAAIYAVLTQEEASSHAA